jgi:hypothetical protein
MALSTERTDRIFSCGVAQIASVADPIYLLSKRNYAGARVKMISSYEDAMALLIRWLRDPDHGNYTRYGYEVYLPGLVTHQLMKERRMAPHDAQREMYETVSDFYAPAWDLCRRGILRPGIREYGQQATPDGSSGNGYSITPFGRKWLAEADRDTFVPTEPERFAEMLARYRERFGQGFQSRGQEAVRCYGAHAYLACCVMAAAAGESILLSTAIAKHGDEESVIKLYAAMGGRKRIEDLLFGKAKSNLRDEYRGLSSLLKYWRDEAGHGKASSISDTEAFYTLALLLRLAIFMNDHWGTLSEK